MTDPFGAITILNDPCRRSDHRRRPAHLLVRTRADEDGNQARANDTSWLDAALPAGGHFISTDFPEAMGRAPTWSTSRAARRRAATR